MAVLAVGMAEALVMAMLVMGSLAAVAMAAMVKEKGGGRGDANDNSCGDAIVFSKSSVIDSDGKCKKIQICERQ